jgi:Uma2 family endonuclease
VTADEYFLLDDGEYRYELVDGVLIVSPSPVPRHQAALAEIVFQLVAYLRKNPVGRIYPETDVQLADDLVYRPELIFLRKELVAANADRVRVAPDLAVEIVSPARRRFDEVTKRHDYERFGVREYWLIDPERDTLSFLRLVGGRFADVSPRRQRFKSQAVPGFVQDLRAVREAWRSPC